MTYFWKTEEDLKETLKKKDDWKGYIKSIRAAGDRVAIGTPETELLSLDDDDIDAVMGIRTCDFCGERNDTVVGTHYGTTHYNRLICKKCIDRVNAYHRSVDGIEKTLNDDGSFANGSKA